MEELSILNMQLEAISPFIRRGGTGVALWNSSFTRGGSFVTRLCPGMGDGDRERRPFALLRTDFSARTTLHQPLIAHVVSAASR